MLAPIQLLPPFLLFLFFFPFKRLGDLNVPWRPLTAAGTPYTLIISYAAAEQLAYIDININIDIDIIIIIMTLGQTSSCSPR